MVSQPRFPEVGEESLAAVRKAVKAGLIEHGKTGRPVVIWRDEKVVWIELDTNGDEVREVPTP